MEGNKKIEAVQVSTEKEVTPLEQSNLEENKDLKIENLELKKKLETANKLLHLVGHDLRGPIGTANEMVKFYIEDFSELSDKEKLNGMTLLSNDFNKIYRLTVDLIEFAYYQNNEIKPIISELNLLEQIEISIDSLLDIAKQKQITFNLNGTNEEAKVLADSKMLQIIIRNLSANAIKFTNPGGNIFITSQKVKDNIEISVIDDGIGLSEKEMDKLFDKIGESKSGTNKEKGTGFGLHFCKELVDEMGGTIRVESVEGHGAKFTVSLPAAKE
ncbi:MAG: sensor histidine kinase [Candidatus Paceibacterota bacterium]|jgi:signal transduction histidine kinase